MQQFIASYGYLAIFVLMVAESACIPVPSEVTMVFGSALAAGAVAGAHLNLALVIAVGVTGNYIAWCAGASASRAGSTARSATSQTAAKDAEPGRGHTAPGLPTPGRQAPRRCSTQTAAPSAASVSATKMPASMDWNSQKRLAGW